MSEDGYQPPGRQPADAGASTGGAGEVTGVTGAWSDGAPGDDRSDGAVGGDRPDDGPVGPGGDGQPPPETGHPEIDASLRAVAEVAAAAPADQLVALQAAHETLRATLSSIDEG